MPSNNASLLALEPSELVFALQSGSKKEGFIARLTLKNEGSDIIGFKFKTNAPTKYSVKPVLGVVKAADQVQIMVKSDAKVTAADKFLIQTVKLTGPESDNLDNASWKDIERLRISEQFIECRLAEPSEFVSAPLKTLSPSIKSATQTPVSKKQKKRGYTGLCLFITSLLVLVAALLVPYQSWMDCLQTAQTHGNQYYKLALAKLAELQK